MSLRTRVEPIDRDIALMIAEDLSPKAQSAMLAQFAGEQIEDARQTNRQVLGRIPRTTITVDGRVGAALESVKPNGKIVAEFDVVDRKALLWVQEQLRKHSPVSFGRDPDPGVEYLDSHKLFVDGNESDVDSAYEGGREYVFANVVPYAAKIERGESSQAPDGVYQVIPALARREFPGMDVSFDYRSVGSLPRMPSIVILMRR